MRRNDVLNPTSPVKAAGMRIDPPPSVPVPIGTRPPETAAAVPPEEPPGVRSVFHGLVVVPCTRVLVYPTSPISLLVVCTTGIAPPRSRILSTCTIV